MVYELLIWFPKNVGNRCWCAGDIRALGWMDMWLEYFSLWERVGGHDRMSSFPTEEDYILVI